MKFNFYTFFGFFFAEVALRQQTRYCTCVSAAGGGAARSVAEGNGGGSRNCGRPGGALAPAAHI